MKQFPNNEITVDIDCFCTIKTVMVTYQPDWNSGRHTLLLHY